MPELPGFDLVVVRLLLPEDQEHEGLDGGTFERTIGIRDVLQCDSIELSLVYVGDPVILSSLARGDRGLQVILEPDFRKTVSNHRQIRATHTH